MPTIELNDSNGFKIATLTLETQDPITVNNLIIRLRNNTHLINSDSQFFVENQEIFLNSIVNSNQIITVVSNHTILPPVPSVDELKSTISLILSNTNEKLVLTDSIFQVMTNLFMSRLSQICQEKAIDEAINLFKHAKLYQSNLTEKLLSLNISINSLYDSSTESLMFICNDIKTGKPLILKIPRQDNEKPSEFRVLENLGESNLLPKTILLNLSIKDQEDDDDVYCLVMERYVSSLANPLQRYSNELIINRAKSLILAVNYIHSFGYVHMDIKLENIFLDSNANWFLGDFGSTIPVNTRIKSITSCLYPTDIYEKTRSSFHFDWFGVSVCLLMIWCGERWHNLLFDDGKVSGDKVASCIEIIDDQELKSLIARLVSYNEEAFYL